MTQDASRELPTTKHCPTCGRDLPRTDFHADKSRHDGLKWQCRECAKSKRREKAEQHSAQQDQYRMNAGIAFEDLYQNPDMRKWINRHAKRYAGRHVEDRLDLQQEGWLGAAMSTGGDTDEIADDVRKAIYRAYRRDWIPKKDRVLLLEDLLPDE